MDGKYSWVICFMSFLAQACSCGFYISFGTLFVAIVDDYGTSETEAALVGSISYSLCLLFGCIASPLCTRFGCRQVSAVGSVLMSLGLLLSSFVQSMEMLYFTFGIIFSAGASAVFFSSLLVLAENFNKNYALAVGISSSGTGAGGFAFASLTEKLLEKFGLRTTFRYLAAMGAVLLIGALLYGKSHPVQLATDNKNRKKRKVLDFKVWKNGAFVIWSIIVCILFFVYYVPYVHLVNLAIDLAIPISKASSLLGYVSIASCIGKIIFGKIADHPRVNRLYLIQFSLLVVSICHTLVPLSRTYAALTVYCFVYGGFDGCFNSLLAVIVGDIVGKENLHNAIGAMYLLSSTFLMFGPPLAGYLYSLSGSYDSSFFIAGGAVAVSCCLMFLVPWFIPVQTIGTEKLLTEEETSEGASSSFQSEKVYKKDSWITYDSGIDLTSKDINSFSCNLDQASQSTTGSQKKPPKERKISALFERYIRIPRRTLIPGSITNSFAVSRLDLNSDELIVVEKVAIV